MHLAMKSSVRSRSAALSIGRHTGTSKPVWTGAFRPVVMPRGSSSHRGIAKGRRRNGEYRCPPPHRPPLGTVTRQPDLGPGTTGALSSGLTTPNEIPSARVLRGRRPRPAWGTGLVLTAASAGHAGDQLTVVASVVAGLHHWLERYRSLPYVRAAAILKLAVCCVLLPLVGRWQIKLGRSGDAHSGADLGVLVARRCCRLPLTNVAPAVDG